MQILLSNPKKLVLQEEKSKTIDKLTVLRIVDLPKIKKVRVFIDEIDEPIILWEGESYDAIGQWTDQNVQNRLIELYS